MKNYRIGLIGLGHIAGVHLTAYNAIKGVEVVAGADISKKSQESFLEKKPGIAIYTDYREMLDKEHLDIVSVCSHTPTHAEITIESAKHKPKAILCEKPIASNVKDAKKMLEVCRQNNVKLTIGHNARYAKIFQEVKHRLDLGEIGKLIWLRGVCNMALNEQGSHVVDLMNMFTDEVGVSSVFGQIDNSSKKYFQGMPSEDCAIAVIQYKNGVHGYLECVQVFDDSISYLANRQIWAYIHLYGEHGEIRAEFNTTKPYLLIRNRKYRDWTRFDSDSHPDSFIAEMKDFVDAIDEDRESLSNGEKGLVTLEILHAVIISSERRGRVRFPSFFF